MIEIRSWCCGTVIVSGDTFKHALERARCEGISLRYADLTGFFFYDQIFTGLNLTRADLRGTRFRASRFDDANLTDVVVNSSTKFVGCRMENANFTAVRLYEGMISASVITGMNLGEGRSILDV